MKKGQPFHGKLTERPIDFPIETAKAVKVDDPIWIVEGVKLREMSTDTRKNLKNTRIVITDSSSGLTEVIRGLQQYVKDHPNEFINRTWDECFPQRFIVMRNINAFQSLKHTLQYGHPVNAEEAEKEEGMDFYSHQMKKITLFGQLVEDGFFKAGSKSSLKAITNKQHKPHDEGVYEGELLEPIKKYVQARIPNHRDVMPIWDIIEPALTQVDEALEIPVDYQQQAEEEADHSEINLQMMDNNEADEGRPLLDVLGYRPPFELASKTDIFSKANEYRLRKYRECLNGATELYKK